MRRRLWARGPREAGDVWESYAQLDQWATWAPHIRRVEADASRIAAGVTGCVHGPAGLRVRFVITAVDESARTWTWRVQLGPVVMVLEHGVIAVPAGTLTWLALEGPGAVVAGYPPVARYALPRLVRLPR